MRLFDSPSYQRLSDGVLTTADDPERGIWFSCGPCGYWTDDWAKVDCGPHLIPLCPVCRCPGFQITALEWFEHAQRYENDGHPLYMEFLRSIKERCSGPNGPSLLERYKIFASGR